MLVTDPVPAKSPLHIRRSWPYTAGPPRWAQAVEQIRQREQVFGAEQRSPGGCRHEGVRFFDVGPTRRQRSDTLVTGLSEEHPVLPPGVGEADQFVLLAPQWMERVGDTEPLPIAAAPSS